MATQKPVSLNTQKDQQESMARRKLWGTIFVLLLPVMGIVFALPFARDERTRLL